MYNTRSRAKKSIDTSWNVEEVEETSKRKSYKTMYYDKLEKDNEFYQELIKNQLIDTDYVPPDDDDDENIFSLLFSNSNVEKDKKEILKEFKQDMKKMKVNKTKKRKMIQEYKKLLKEEEKSEEISEKVKLFSSNLPYDLKKTVYQKIKILDNTSIISSDYSKLKYWLNDFFRIPFNLFSTLPKIDNYSEYILEARDKFDRYIYNNINVKNEFLQLIGQWITNPNSKGLSIGLKGPPGCGKTSISLALSDILQKPIDFIPLGCVNDSSYFVGHNYTYEGSQCGRIVNTLIQKQCMNPIFYFDELDKIFSNNDKQQKISNILIHLTDFTQNHQFNDSYYNGIPFDLSQCIFIFSFNDENIIDPIIKNRLKIIEMDVLHKQDKIKIVKEYVIPKYIQNINLTETVIFPDDVLMYILNEYTEKEEGVRNFKKNIETILSKINVSKLIKDTNLPYFLSNIEFPLTITSSIVDILLKKINKEHINSMYL
jgi:ATP-dependent Lon protease